MLTGGCFQNRILSEQAIQHLRDRGFVPHWHQRVPPNDGGIKIALSLQSRESRGIKVIAGQTAL